MPTPRKYMAASVPRFLRQTRLAYLPLNCVIGSHMTQSGGVAMFYDIIMLPVPEFTRMRGHVGLQHVIAPALKAGPTFNPGFVLADTRQVVAPDDEPDPVGYAKNYFLMKFGLLKADAPRDAALRSEDADFSDIAKECTKSNDVE